MINKTINLLKEMLDITLDLQLFYIKDINNNLEMLEKSLSHIFTLNKDYFNNFIDFMINTKEGNIYSIIDSIFANYIIICLDEKNKDYILLGPYMYLKPSNDISIKKSDYNFDINEINILNKYYKSLPIINRNKMTNIIKTIVKNIYGEESRLEYIEKSNLSNFKYNKSKSNDRHSNSIMETLESKSLEINASTEYKLFLAVREGDKFFASKCLDKLLPQTNINSNVLYNIRDYKNKLIYYNTLLKKAAELESAPIIYLETLFSTYINKIEASRDFNDLYTLVPHMSLDYCNAVSNYKLKGYSPLVRKAINYITLNLGNDLSVQDLANLFYVSPTYLARLFKKEVNCSVIEYINKQRIRRSTFLLKDTDLSIQHIGNLVGINDLNYFSRLFKKHMNKTPSQYRKDNT